MHGGRDSSETRRRECRPPFRPVTWGLPVKPELLVQRLATFRTKKAADARIMAECARVAKDVVFVAADDSQAVITAEMRELISEALDLLADTEG